MSPVSARDERLRDALKLSQQSLIKRDTRVIDAHGHVLMGGTWVGVTDIPTGLEVMFKDSEMTRYKSTHGVIYRLVVLSICHHWMKQPKCEID